MKLAKCSAKLVANFRRSLAGDFRASFAGEIVRSISTKTPLQISPSNFTMRFWVVAGPTIAKSENYQKRPHGTAFWRDFLCVLIPALNVSKNSCVFPCLDKAFGKRTRPKMTRNAKNPQLRPTATNRRLIATNRRLIATNRRLIATNRPKSATNSD